MVARRRTIRWTSLRTQGGHHAIGSGSIDKPPADRVHRRAIEERPSRSNRLQEPASRTVSKPAERTRGADRIEAFAIADLIVRDDQRESGQPMYASSQQTVPAATTAMSASCMA